MAKIDRYQGNYPAFAQTAQSSERTIFGAQPGDPVVQSDSLTDNINANYQRGWGVLSDVDKPPKEWFNGVSYAVSQTLAYLHQAGIPGHSPDQEYHTDSVTVSSGTIYISKVDDNTGNDPATSSTQWESVNQQILNNLATVAETGAYSDLSGLPTLGTAAARNMGTGLTQVPDNSQLNTRLGTTGNLGDAATRNVGTASGNVAEYIANGLSGSGYRGTAPVLSDLNTAWSAIGGCGYIGTNSQTTNSPFNGGGLIFGRSGSEYTEVLSRPEVGRLEIRGTADGTNFSGWQKIWYEGNLSPMTTDTAQVITGEKIFSHTSGFVRTNRDNPGARSIAGFSSSFDGGSIVGGAGFEQDGTFRVSTGSASVNNEAFTVDPNGNGRIFGDFLAQNIDAIANIQGSDPKLKENKRIVKITREQLDSIALYYFQWKETKRVHESLRGKEDIGIMADQVRKVFPECVYVRSNKTLGVDYAKFATCFTLADYQLRREGK